MYGAKIMKYLTISILLLNLIGCNNTTPPDLSSRTFIVAGQSNAERCDWTYFEDMTGARIINIAKGGYSIDRLIAEYDHPELTDIRPEGIFFVHGETDAINHTPPDYYTSQVEALRLIISGQAGYELSLFISTVGYISGHSPIWYDKLITAVKAYDNPYWVIAFDGARYFSEQDKRLKDGVHFNESGCHTIMNAMAIAADNILYVREST